MIAQGGVCLDPIAAAWVAKFLFAAIGVTACIFAVDFLKEGARRE